MLYCNKAHIKFYEECKFECFAQKMWLFNHKYPDIRMLMWGTYILKFPELITEPAVNKSFSPEFIAELNKDRPVFDLRTGPEDD